MICSSTPGHGSPCRLHFLTSTSHDLSSEPHPGMPRSKSTYDHWGYAWICNPRITRSYLVWNKQGPGARNVPLCSPVSGSTGEYNVLF